MRADYIILDDPIGGIALGRVAPNHVHVWRRSEHPTSPSLIRLRCRICGLVAAQSRK